MCQRLFSVQVVRLVVCLFVIGFALPSAQEFIASAQTQNANEQLVLPRADDPAGTTTGVPDYQMDTLSGRSLRLSSLRGKPVLLDFFSATCPHCQKHAPFVAELAKRYRDRGLTVVNLSANNQYVDGELVQTYARDAKIEDEVAWTPHDLFRFYLQGADGSVSVPQAILFDAQGRFVARFDAWEEADKPRIEATIAKLLTSDKNQPTSSTK